MVEMTYGRGEFVSGVKREEVMDGKVVMMTVWIRHV